jgi:phage gp46-like protein
MSTIFDGDPRIFIGQNGAYLDFRGCQPVMDSGIENGLIISLYTKEGWAGNYLLDNSDQKIGSKFEEANEKPITRQYLLDRIDASNKAVEWMVKNKMASEIPIDVSNPSGLRVDYMFTVKPPGRNLSQILLTKNGINWQEQVLNPASEK